MPAILFSSKITASRNIASELMKLGFEKTSENEWEFEKTRLIDTKADVILDVPTNYETDYFIVISPHRSEANLKSLTVHIPGNWDSADFGGKPRTLNFSYPSRQKILLQKMHGKNKKFGLDFSVNFEVDHHGPTIGKPIIFTEIGSSESEWKNPLAAKIIAESVFETICETQGAKSETGNPESKTFFGVGGGHYAPVFSRYAIERDFGFGHMLPKYKADSIAGDTFGQAMEKNFEKVEKIMLDKKGVNKGQREKIEKLANEFGVEIIRI